MLLCRAAGVPHRPQVHGVEGHPLADKGLQGIPVDTVQHAGVIDLLLAVNLVAVSLSLLSLHVYDVQLCRLPNFMI